MGQVPQDTAKSIFEPEDGITLIDLNRAGNALIEVVSDADMQSVLSRHLHSFCQAEDAGESGVQQKRQPMSAKCRVSCEG